MAAISTKLEVSVNMYSNASQADMDIHNKEIIDDLTRTIKDFFINKSWYTELYTDYDQSEKVGISIDTKLVEQTHY